MDGALLATADTSAASSNVMSPLLPGGISPFGRSSPSAGYRISPSRHSGQRSGPVSSAGLD